MPATPPIRSIELNPTIVLSLRWIRFMSALLISLSVTISNRLSALIVISAISLAISAPSLIAIPTSAAERAGESFMPSLFHACRYAQEIVLRSVTE